MAEEAIAETPSFKLSVTGFSVMCAWHFLMIFTAVFNLSPWVGSGRHVWMQLAIYFGLAASYALISLLSKRIVARFFRSGATVWRIANICIAVLATAASLFVILSYNTPLLWQVFVYLLLAFAGSLLIFPWLQLPQAKDDEGVSYRNLAFNMGLGGVLAIIIGFLQSPIVYVGICVLPLLSSILLIVRWEGTAELEEDVTGDIDASRKTPFREVLVTNLHFLIFGIAFGFCQGAFAQDMSINFVLNDSVPLFGAVFSAIVIFFTPYKYLKSYGIFTLQRASMLLFFAGLMLAIFFSQPSSFLDSFSASFGYKIAQAIVFAGFNIFEFGFMIFSFTWAVSLKTDLASYIGANRTVIYFGMGAGLAIGFGVYLLAGQISGFYVLAAGAAIVLLTFTALPFFDEFAPYGKIETIGEAREHAAELEAEIAQEEKEEKAADKPHVARWRERVIRIADEHDLSERERDVFFYLAKGRNAAFIQQELWISIHTVKTHIANIYRKLGVHSIQEVLDMVDTIPDSGAQEGTPGGKEQEAKG